MIKEALKRWFLSFDASDKTGLDYKKLTAFWGVLASSLLIGAYCLKEIKIFWLGVSVVVREELPEFKWILGLILAFILTLTYFTNHKTLTEFLTKFKKDAEPEKQAPDSPGDK